MDLFIPFGKDTVDGTNVLLRAMCFQLPVPANPDFDAPVAPVSGGMAAGRLGGMPNRSSDMTASLPWSFGR